MRSAVVSVSSNIAEGAGRSSAADMARFLQIAIGSTSELQSQILIAKRLGLTEEVGEDLAAVSRVRKQLIRLRQRVQNPNESP
jgi:four helix bundle protein